MRTGILIRARQDKILIQNGSQPEMQPLHQYNSVQLLKYFVIYIIKSY